ncbi:hypothetical protein IKW75_00120 [Candidatus Saccharibacteria bacterium]|nr:hypothetical protein [Candidatus Saccharibacteria bacterium]
MDITVDLIRQAKPEQKLDLIIQYINSICLDEELSSDDELAIIDAVMDRIPEGIALDEWATIKYVPLEEGYSTYNYIRDYYGVDRNSPLAVDELYQRYPKLFHEGEPASEQELSAWYSSITVQIMVRIADDAKKYENAPKERDEDWVKKQRKAISWHSRPATYSHKAPIYNPWILPGKFDEFCRRRRERMNRNMPGNNQQIW